MMVLSSDRDGNVKRDMTGALRKEQMIARHRTTAIPCVALIEHYAPATEHQELSISTHNVARSDVGSYAAFRKEFFPVATAKKRLIGKPNSVLSTDR